MKQNIVIKRKPWFLVCLFIQAVSPSEKNVIDKIIDIGPQLAGTCDYYIVHSKYVVFKGIFINSNSTFLWHKSEVNNKNKIFPKFKLIWGLGDSACLPKLKFSGKISHRFTHDFTTTNEKNI